MLGVSFLVDSAGKLTINVNGEANGEKSSITINCVGNTTINSEGNVDIIADGDVAVDGKNINLRIQFN